MRNTLRALARFGLILLTVVAHPEAAAPTAPRPVQPTALNLPAPKLEGRAELWLNTGGRRLNYLRGRVYVVEFWTFGCINCQRNLPAYARWQRKFAGQNLTIIGVHTPETDEEKNTSNVRQKVRDLEITYPVLLDPQSTNWKLWQQQIWPAVYLIDKRGNVRYRWLGELESPHPGGEERMTRCIEELLAEPLR